MEKAIIRIRDHKRGMLYVSGMSCWGLPLYETDRSSAKPFGMVEAAKAACVWNSIIRDMAKSNGTTIQAHEIHIIESI